MTKYVFESWMALVRLDCTVRVGGLKALLETVQRQPVRIGCPDSPSSEVLCQSVDFACALYIKQVLCLQRSAATALLLKRYGWNAEMVIGAQIVPPKSHAWVELGGNVVNDKPYMLDIYQVLARC